VKSDRSAIAAAIASILLFAMVNHISPASGKPYESRSRLRCYLLPLRSLQEQVEPGAKAKRGAVSLSPDGLA
jgi:hypothetical protein